MKQKPNDDNYVLLKSGTEDTYFVSPSQNVCTLKSAKKFISSNDAIDYMLHNQLLDKFDLVKID
jgi:hypothetical protein